MKDFQFITNSSPEYIENLYQDFVKNPDTVDPEFKKFLKDLILPLHRAGTVLTVQLLPPTAQPSSKEQKKQLLKLSTALTGKKNWAHIG